jgi:excisionase family DNA binding protein
MRKKTSCQIPLDQRLTLTINSTADALDVGRSTVYELIRKGMLQTVAIDGMRRITGDSVRALATPATEKDEAA